jgi:hydroxyethylthiazole kinase
LTTTAKIDAGRHLMAMHTRAPLVHNITNYVAMTPMANVLLAAGASPAMIHAREEAAEFTRIADALTVNIGTLSPAWVDAMEDAARAAGEAEKPWVLDPVAAGATAYRRAASQRLMALRPTVIRGNASEILALAGAAAAGKGVDSTDAVDAAPATALARETGCVVAVTGAVDIVTDGRRNARIANGHPLMPRVTALGCALTGVVAAFVAAGDDAFEATVAALAFYGLAGERAAANAAGPGSFMVAFLDALAAIDAESLQSGARIA